MSDNKLVKTVMNAAVLTGIATGIGFLAKKVFKMSFIADPSNSVENYVKLATVIAGSTALKDYLAGRKILPTDV